MENFPKVILLDYKMILRDKICKKPPTGSIRPVPNMAQV